MSQYKNMSTSSVFSSCFSHLIVTGCWIVRAFFSFILINNLLQFLAPIRLFWISSLLFDLTTERLPRLIDVTYTTKMRRYKTVAHILLTLSAINFAFAAPVALRGIHEVRVDVVDPSKDGTTTQKTWDLSGERSMNAADSTSASLIPRSSDSDHWSEQGPHNARSPTDSNDAPGPSNPRPLIDLNASPPLSPDPTPETHPLDLPSTQSNIIDPASSSQPPNPGPGGAPLPAAFPEDSPPPSSWDRTPASSSSTIGSYPSSWDRWETAEIDPSSPSISSEPSTASSINPSTDRDSYPSTASSSNPSIDSQPPAPASHSSPSTDNQPSASPSSSKSPTESPPPNAEPEHEGHFVEFFKGRIRRRISSSSDATQGKFQGIVDSRVYVIDSSLPHLPTFNDPNHNFLIQ